MDENVTYCTAASISSIKSLAAMELIPASLLDTEYVALETKLYQRYRSELDPSNQASLWSFVVDKADLQASGKQDNNPQEQVIDSDCNKGLIIMSSVQAYLERASPSFVLVTKSA